MLFTRYDVGRIHKRLEFPLPSLQPFKESKQGITGLGKQRVDRSEVVAQVTMEFTNERRSIFFQNSGHSLQDGSLVSLDEAYGALLTKVAANRWHAFINRSSRECATAAIKNNKVTEAGHACLQDLYIGQAVTFPGSSKTGQIDVLRLKCIDMACLSGELRCKKRKDTYIGADIVNTGAFINQKCQSMLNIPLVFFDICRLPELAVKDWIQVQCVSRMDLNCLGPIQCESRQNPIKETVFHHSAEVSIVVFSKERHTMPVDGHHPGTFLRRRGEPTDSGFQPLALDSAKFRSDRNQRLSFALSGPPDE